MAIRYTEPRKGPWQTLERLTPQWMQLLADFKKTELETELQKQKIASDAQYKRDVLNQREKQHTETLEQKRKQFELTQNNNTARTLITAVGGMGSEEAKTVLDNYFESNLSNKTSESINNSITALREGFKEKSNLESNRQNALNDIITGKSNDFPLWMGYYNLDPNNSEDLKIINQGKNILTERKNERTKVLNSINSITNAMDKFKDPDGKISPQFLPQYNKLKTELLNIVDKMNFEKVPLKIGGILINTNKFNIMSDDEIFNSISAQIENVKRPVDYQEFGPNINFPTQLLTEPFTSLFGVGMPGSETQAPADTNTIAPTDTTVMSPTDTSATAPMDTTTIDTTSVLPTLTGQDSLNIQSAIDSAALANRREQEQIYDAGGDFVYLPIPGFSDSKVNKFTGEVVDVTTGEKVRTFNKADIDSLMEINPGLYSTLPFVQNFTNTVAPVDTTAQVGTIGTMGTPIEIISSGAGKTKNVIRINNIEKTVTPTEMDVINKTGRWNRMPEKQRNKFINRIAKKFNISPSELTGMEGSQILIDKKADNFEITSEGLLGGTTIKINNIEKPVSSFELSILRGEDWGIGVKQSKIDRTVKKLAKKFNVSESDIRNMPFAKFIKE
tara:strand:+ start:7074 stop:8924 length:1851 start_codon:yes stop_codon:yes gene_type:complete